MKNLVRKAYNHIISNKIKWLIVAGFGLITLLVSWNSDDAYHAYIMAQNLVEGNGFVYHVGYRVTASTCPLFTLLTACVYALFGYNYMYLAGILLGVVCSTIAIYILVFKICKTNSTAVLSVCVLLGCYCFMTYTTAGLENSLLFLLSSLFLVVFTKNEEFSEKELFLLALVLSLLAMTRMDSVLLFVLAICIGYLFFTKIKFIKRVYIGFVGLLPFIVWEIFSIIYYGFPFPNTMYVKLNTGFPKSDYLVRGIDYIYRSSLVDVLLLLSPMIFLILSVLWKNKKMITISIGCFLYIVYVVYVGGDFMVGRHLTTTFFVSILGMIILFNTKPESCRLEVSIEKVLITFCILELICSTWIRPVAKEELYEIKWDPSKTGVADERNWYYDYTGFLPYISAMLDGENSVINFLKDHTNYADVMGLKASGDLGTVDFFAPGIMNYYVQKEGAFYLSDCHGLMDPLLSHLPAYREEHWRIGHMKREIPEGYRESVMTGTNQIVNESLHEYYDKILLIATADIWDKERLDTIVKMNLGEYDYLIEAYLEDIEK